MRIVPMAAALALLAGPALADGSCTANATAKKLAGAAKTSFATKCVNDAVGT